MVQSMFDVVLMNDKSFDDLVAGGFFGVEKKATAVDDNYNVFTVKKGEKVCIKIRDFSQMITGTKKGYVLESPYLEAEIPENDIIGKRLSVRESTRIHARLHIWRFMLGRTLL